MSLPEWNPIIGLPEASLVSVVLLAAGCLLAWKGSQKLRLRVRGPLLALRFLGLACLALIWLNPGRWSHNATKEERNWVVLVDRSGSMAAAQPGAKSRWEAATRVAEDLKQEPHENGKILAKTFSQSVEEDFAKNLAPDGSGSDLVRTLGAVLDRFRENLGGVVILSDGRQTTRAPLDAVALRARGLGVPIHTVPFGTADAERDVAIAASPRLVTAFKSQPVRIVANVSSRGFGPIKPTVILSDANDKEIAKKEVAVADGGSERVVFELKESPSEFVHLRIAPWDGEYVSSNNADSVRIRVLESKTRVLMLEGAPYWDTKFLAQLLRHQEGVEILTVHRLNQERYFRVGNAGAEPLQSPDSVFPQSAAELGRYDLIVFGKGADGFLDPARLAALQGFVRDQGGAVLFARGKAYEGKFPGLEPFEPVEWGESLGSGFRLVPSPAGGDLFGALLPAADDPIWKNLPPLSDANSVVRLRSFARVYAEGEMGEHGARFPLLVARRFGRGLVATLNADGLWRWSFQQQGSASDPLYRDLWVQLMQWCATYSEFLPGEDFAVRLREQQVEPGEMARAVISYRGTDRPGLEPYLRITCDGQKAGESAAVLREENEAGREWNATVTPSKPGRYVVSVGDRSRADLNQGRAVLNVPAPPKESDDLRADPALLAALAAKAGGKTFQPSEVAQLKDAMRPEQTVSVAAESKWESLWPKWWGVLAVAALFGGEWWLRRREGLL